LGKFGLLLSFSSVINHVLGIVGQGNPGRPLVKKVRGYRTKKGIREERTITYFPGTSGKMGGKKGFGLHRYDNLRQASRGIKKLVLGKEKSESSIIYPCRDLLLEKAFRGGGPGIRWGGFSARSGKESQYSGIGSSKREEGLGGRPNSN